MSTKLRKLSFIASLSAAAVLAACGGGGADAGNGSLAVSLTDAPACGYDAVNVTVTKVRVHRSADAADNAGGWIDITPPAGVGKINLLDFTNGRTLDFLPVSLPAGHYTQLRLVLDRNTGNRVANSIVLSSDASGNEIAIDTPSAAQSGIKLINGFDVEPGQQLNLVLDFDACKSIVTKGNGNYALKPVIKMIPAALNGIDGYVDKALLSSNVMVTAQQNGEVISATAPDKDTGRFYLTRLAPGNYDVVITADDHSTAVITQVPVASPTSTVLLSTGTAPINLQSAGSPSRSISGTVTLNPASTTEEVPYVAAKQSFAAGPTVTVKYRGADLSTGAYTLDKLPGVAPQLGQYSATLPIALTTQTTTSPGTGKYAVSASAVGYQTSTPITFDVNVGDATNTNFTLTK
ncbi:DUF4382 domain-containing protein [Noviherbaspirillum massiliense]|uniref:DUF4382 domain-containing protein n=1 Tax=Noviherbaspirillum massiliense TaxID=1465823 RepID=UPI0002EA9035|nr:DUF4382 domain-containing protein [Noviherbaspirillum massiliense]